MFTGIIQHLGRFKGFRKGRKELVVQVSPPLFDFKVGESLAVNGVCLSLIQKERDNFLFNLSEETLRRTNLGRLRKGCQLNLEPPLSPSSFLSGHMVTGHIDGTGKILKIINKTQGKRMTFSFPSSLRSYFILKGSVAINGVSLTVAALNPSRLDVEIIPITLNNSNLSDLKRGDEVNIECDIIGKYVYNYLSWINHESRWL